MNAQELIKARPELFDGYDGTERDAEQQKQLDDYAKQLMAGAPDYIKQATQAQPAA